MVYVLLAHSQKLLLKIDGFSIAEQLELELKGSRQIVQHDVPERNLSTALQVEGLGAARAVLGEQSKMMP